MAQRWTPCFLTTLLCVIVIVIVWILTDWPLAPLAPPGGHGLNKRNHLGNNNPLDHPEDSSPLDWYTKAFNFSSSFELNMWYRYAQTLAKSQNLTDCYVCTRMPIATRNPHIVPKPVTNVTTLFPHILRSSLAATVLNQTYWSMISGPKPNAKMLNFTHLLKTNDTKNNPIYGPVHLTKDVQFDCFYNNDNFPNLASIPMGNVNPTYCFSVHKPCLKNDSQNLQTACLFHLTNSPTDWR